MFDIRAVSTNTYHGCSLEEALSGIAKAGFSCVELACVEGWTNHFSIINYREEDLKSLRSSLSRLGLRVVSISAHSDLSTPEGVSYLEKALDLARILGAQVVNTGTIEEEKKKGILISNLQVLAPEAEKRGVKIGLEIHGNFLKDGLRARELMEELNHPAVGINYDTGNAIFYGGVCPEEDVKNCLPWIVHFHLKDKRGGYKVWDFPPLGEGDIDFGKIFALAREEKIEVPWSVEIEFDGKFQHSREFVDQAVKKSFDYLENLLKKGKE
ncbi:MAG TPA: sugar phosphate isomerase/epimerase family protein [Candidatus Atribacteria bacterium]|nr:sugar phosphate isomerase/epimerase family protein [Candidatus Atribacteria bacterium]